MSEEHTLDLASLRARLSAAPRKDYWRTLEELAETPQFEEMVHREFPRQASEWHDPVSRRNFLKLMSASLALAGLSACGRPPRDTIVPYARAPEEIVPGQPLFFATAMSLAGGTIGLLVESHEGRPTKIEGNPNHPASLGATDVFAQASILGLYDPDRSQAIAYLGDIRPWSALLADIQMALEAQRERRGAGLHFLTETVTSPTLAQQIQDILKELPDAKWHQYEPLGSHSAHAGAQLAFGRDVNTICHFDKADVILALDADFLACGPGSVRYAHDFAQRRRPQPSNPQMSRLYVVESSPSITGAKADHHLPMRPSEIEGFARAVASGLGVGGGAVTASSHARWVAAVVRDLEQHRGSSIVIAGEQQPPQVHALAHAMNHALGNAGSSVLYTEPVEFKPVNQLDSLRDLVQDLDAGRVGLLVILGGNPVYTAPADLAFSDRLLKANLRMHLSLYQDETSALCQWNIPEAHYLESWGDARAYDGTASIVQPLIAPLYGGKTAHEMLAAFTNQPERSSHEIVRDYWKKQRQSGDFEQFWRKSLNDGFIADTAFQPISVSPSASGFQGSSRAASPDASSLEIAFRPDPAVFDGRFSNNGWLQELPRPLTRLTWDNAALLSPATAERLGLSYRIATTGGEHGHVYADVVEFEYKGRKVRAPTWITPGHPDDCVTVFLGYGRTHAGQVGNGAGFNANLLRTSEAPWFDSGLTVHKTGDRYPLACTQFHHNMEGRGIVRSATLDEYRKHPDFAHENAEEPPKTFTLYPPEHRYEGYAWGMAIDLNSCVGCGACVVACQSENNIPIVGKNEVGRGREMHWLRIDHYYQGSLGNPENHFQPVPCMHCENAPCEVVCPVAATVHSSEGLNDMVYNRCVGTRYCSNNCPYKVRRFNFLQYSDWTTPSLELARNPDVTVRSRGVMEKCTYCVQRINRARINAEEEDRKIRDGEIRTACQQACPAQAIIFGNINDPKSRVAKLKADSRNYGLLAELNTRPRTTYLAEVRNPNPELEGA
jgi:MoCo/4Fe-4S cofactor protein with predicted Tat translocation signal